LAIFQTSAVGLENLPALAAELRRLLPQYAGTAGGVPERIVYLGSGPLAYAARESALKVMELSAGKIPALWDSCLGFRHGPKSFVTDNTSVVVFTGPDEPSIRYDTDLLLELRDQFPQTRVTSIGVNGDISFSMPMGPTWASPVCVAAAQVYAVIWSSTLGMNVDNPFAGKNWQTVDRQRIATPTSYEQLVQAVAQQVVWADSKTKTTIDVGIGAAGLINPITGRALTANLCASGKALPNDIEKLVGRPVTYINDCRAFALSEAVFGAGKGAATVLGVILGTGIGAGLCVNGKLLSGPTYTGGEVGHISASATLITKYQLPITPCGCGKKGCIETYLSGPGMSLIAQSLISRKLSPEDVAELRHSNKDVQSVWNVWCEMAADLLRNLTLTVDPDKIVLGGGLSRIDGLLQSLNDTLRQAQIGDFPIATLELAEGGDASGARGAAYAAWQRQQG